MTGSAPASTSRLNDASGGAGLLASSQSTGKMAVRIPSHSASLYDDPFVTTSPFSSGSGYSTPTSPSKHQRKIYGDRFIPNRSSSTDLRASFQLLESSTQHNKPPGSGSSSKSKRKAHSTETDAQREEANKTFNALLKTELFGPDAVDMSALHKSPARHGNRPATVYSANSAKAMGKTPSTPSAKPLFSYGSPSRKRQHSDSGRIGGQGLDSPTHERYSVSPVRYESQKLLQSPKKAPRQLSKVPFKVLDAPELADDYYLNLVDWSSTNMLAVGLGSCVYLWSAATSKVTRLCDLNEGNTGDSVTSINWVTKGNHLAIGTKLGGVQIWDADKQKLIRRMSGHTARVGALAWNEAILSSGSHDRLIYHRDVRVPAHYVTKLAGHRQEVCGLKWNTSENQLASGGNDNKLFVWDKMNDTPLYRFTEHIAAIKAIAWNPHQHGILASGGGTADMKIRFWNTLTGSLLSEIDTGSQICNLMWSKNSNELVSTHGFSAGQVQNQVCIWKYPSMQQVATLTGHTYRVLYLAMSPDGQTICSGAGDETLRFWHAFPKRKNDPKSTSSILDPLAQMR